MDTDSFFSQKSLQGAVNLSMYVEAHADCSCVLQELEKSSCQKLLHRPWVAVVIIGSSKVNLV